MPEAIGYYMIDEERKGIEHVTDYSEDGLASLAEAEQRGVEVFAVYDDGTEERVAASDVSDPNVGRTATASLVLPERHMGENTSDGFESEVNAKLDAIMAALGIGQEEQR